MSEDIAGSRRQPVTPAALGQVRRLLESAYGRPERPAPEPVLDGLVGTLLAQHTTGPLARRAFARLRERYPTWADVHAAPAADLADAVGVAGLGPTRAARLLAILDQLAARPPGLDLEWLRGEPDQVVMDYLTRLPGVGVKTAACVLLFTMGREAFPVDTHVARLARRLGWVAETAAAPAIWEELHGRVPAADRLALHVLLIRHGREVCRARHPRCTACLLRPGCPTAPVSGS